MTPHNAPGGQLIYVKNNNRVSLLHLRNPRGKFEESRFSRLTAIVLTDKLTYCHGKTILA